MAALDPRRSSRALRTAQSQSQISSTSSSSSGRAERATRAFHKGTSPQKSTPTASLSSEPPEDSVAATEDTLPTRRRTRGQADDRDRHRASTAKSENTEMGGIDDIQEDDEAVRCICGFDEYPGPPPVDDDPRNASKDSSEFERAAATDDLAGFFVQCDICKVWQHGACVGIMTEESSPDEYFCEQCRKDLHKIFVAKNGQRYSHYLPLKHPSRTTSRQNSLVKDTARSPRERETRETRNSRNNAAQQLSKRRATMNSRDAGYNEAEALRRAIEESKEEALHPAAEGLKRAKRGRSDSEDHQEQVKRLRTSSRSVSPSEDKVFEDSDDGLLNGSGSRSKARSSATVRNQRAERLAERDEKERQKAEQARKRNSRMERRRADGEEASNQGPSLRQEDSVNHRDADEENSDSDPSEELPLAAARSTAANRSIPQIISTTEDQKADAAGEDELPASDLPSPDTPSANIPAPTSHSNNKNSARSHKKRGRNQYTVNREGPDESSPARSQSRDIQKDEHSNGGASGNGKSHANADHARAGLKPKGMSSKVTMTDLKRRAGAILDFISRTQVELAGEASPGLKGSPRPDDGPSPPLVDGKVSVSVTTEVVMETGKDFKDLSCLEMMDTLTGQLVKWQQEYGS